MCRACRTQCRKVPVDTERRPERTFYILDLRAAALHAVTGSTSTSTFQVLYMSLSHESLFKSHSDVYSGPLHPTAPPHRCDSLSTTQTQLCQCIRVLRLFATFTTIVLVVGRFSLYSDLNNRFRSFLHSPVLSNNSGVLLQRFNLQDQQTKVYLRTLFLHSCGEITLEGTLYRHIELPTFGTHPKIYALKVPVDSLSLARSSFSSTSQILNAPIAASDKWADTRRH